MRVMPRTRARQATQSLRGREIASVKTISTLCRRVSVLSLQMIDWLWLNVILAEVSVRVSQLARCGVNALGARTRLEALPLESP